MKIKNEIYIIDDDKMKEIEDILLSNDNCFKILDENKFCVEIPLEKDVNLIICRQHTTNNNKLTQWQIENISIMKIDRNNFCRIIPLRLQRDQKQDIWAFARTRSVKDIGYNEYGNICE